MARPDIYNRMMIDVLSAEVKAMVKNHYTIDAFKVCGCTREGGFAGDQAIPDYEMERHSVFKTSTELGTYNHHSNLVKWKGKYWFAWDNCMVNEEWPGQRTLIAHSDDARAWSEPILVADGDEERGIVRNCGGLYACGDRLYAFIQEKWDLVHATAPGMSMHDNTKVSTRFDLWASSDGVQWEMVKEGHLGVMWMLENPRLTREGRLMGPITTHDSKPGIVLWPGDDPEERPEVIEMPYACDARQYYEGHDEGLFLYGEGSWYTDDENRIWMFERDESASTYLGVALSEDGGQTWTEVMRSNFPDSMSRVFAGRLADGRFFLVGNSTRIHMDRNFFALSLSDDGAKFNKMYRLVKEPTRQRFAGHLKTDGYQYPSCLVDGDRLLIGYSVNKEDIEIGIVDTTEI